MKKLILLIEDDRIVRENTAELLQFANYDVITATNGISGVKKALKNQPDIIICDIMMPKLDGYGVYKLLYSNDKCNSIPFIFLSSKSNHIDRRKGMELGADDYLTKPFDESELLTAIEIRLKKASQKKETQSLVSSSSENGSFAKVKNLNELTKILSNRKTHTYNKGDTLFCEGNISNHIYLVKEGLIKTYKNTSEGKELITGLYKKNQFIGYTSSLGNFPHNEYAESIDDSIIIKINKLDIKSILQSNPNIAIDLLEMLSNNIENIKNKMLQIAYNSVRMRVSKTLLLVVKNDPLKTIIISRSDLANITGVAKETLIRTLSDFREEGLIKTSRTTVIVLDEQKLEKVR